MAYAIIMKSSLDRISRDMRMVDIYILGVTARIVALGRDCLDDGGCGVDFGKPRDTSISQRAWAEWDSVWLLETRRRYYRSCSPAWNKQSGVLH
jgi:hypothetical protein